ncbi:sigma-70 family RNA polymerase sigma factor [Tepidibacillus marianensis]|uniref:sigma-70 family RNA polymerase sigma factor n=1 Tax=Tepidibacillus marianensis TaxID=3131995 RepID=UPI0030D1BFBE
MDQELYQLIVEAKEGKITSFESLITKYKGAVYRQAYSMLNDHMEAEDVTQDVFVKVYYSLTTLESPYAFTSWVTKITFNLCYDRIEKKKKKATIASGNLEQISQKHSLSTDRTMERKNLQLTIEEAMNSLSLEQREILILRDIQGYTYDEISESLKIPVGTVKSRLYNARLALKKNYHNEVIVLNHPEELISSYIDEELEESDRILVEEHLQTCDRCLNLFNEIKELKNLIHFTYQSIQAPSTIEEKIMVKINQEETMIMSIVNKIPWLPMILPLLILVLYITSQPLRLSLGIISSMAKVIFHLIPIVVNIVPFLLGSIIFTSLVAVLFSLWSLRQLMVKKAIF